jgi:drug/metabolite transporter (DMT)-like permease
MLASFLAALFFAFNATCANRSARALGGARANLGRLTVAVVVLATFAHTLGGGLASASLPWFLLSGVIGMGVGDLAVFAALPVLGSRLTVLLTQCLAAPIAALGEWLWLGHPLTGAQIAWGLLILGGVAFAITPSRSHPPRVTVKPIGFLFGFLAACGQGFGALVSRRGVEAALAAGEPAHNAVFGLTAAYQRILGWLRLPARLAAGAAPDRQAAPAPQATAAERQRDCRWMLANGLAGPVLGVGCYQWALATTNSGLVLPIVATAPLLAMPFACFLEGDRPVPPRDHRRRAGRTVAAWPLGVLARLTLPDTAAEFARSGRLSGWCSRRYPREHPLRSSRRPSRALCAFPAWSHPGRGRVSAAAHPVCICEHLRLARRLDSLAAEVIAPNTSFSRRFRRSNPDGAPAVPARAPVQGYPANQTTRYAPSRLGSPDRVAAGASGARDPSGLHRADICGLSGSLAAWFRVLRRLARGLPI